MRSGAIVGRREHAEQATGDVELSHLRHDICAASSRRSGRGSACSRATKLSFDEESQALYDAVAPTHPESYFQGDARRSRSAPAGQGSARRSRRGVRKQFVIPRDRLGQVFDAGDRRVPAPDAAAPGAAGDRELHGRVRDRQVVERLQLVPRQLPQRDPGQHRPADLHRPRHRSGVPRGLSRATTSTTRCSRRT